jgi:hypothetical protein
MNNSPLGLVYNLNIKEPIMPPGPNPPGDPDFQIIPVPFITKIQFRILFSIKLIQIKIEKIIDILHIIY